MTVPYDLAARRFNNAVAFPEECTFDPHRAPEGEKYDFENIKQCKKYYRDNVATNVNKPLHVIGATDNRTGKLDDIVNADAYHKIINDGDTPGFGTWVSSTDKSYCVDTSFTSLSPDVAKQALRDGQESVCRINSNGDHDFPSTEKEIDDTINHLEEDL